MTRRSILVIGFPAARARHVLAELVRSEPEAELWALVHPERAEEARLRARDLGLSDPERLRIVEGDPAALDFGLSGKAYLELCDGIDVVHAAYSVQDPDTSEELAETVNVGAARELVELARASRRLEKIVFYSSVFVSGDRTGRVREHELEAGQGFRNAAERTQAIAERMLRRSGAKVIVLRAGHLLGGPTPGSTSRIVGPHLLMVLLVNAPLDTPFPLPPGAETRLPLTPLDFLARIGVHAAAEIPPGRTIHVVDPDAVTVRRFLELVAERSGHRLDTGFSLGAIPRALIGNPAARLLQSSLRGLFEVLSTSAEYDTEGIVEIATRGGPRCPSLSEYLDRWIESARVQIQPSALDVSRYEHAPFLVA
ncbi:MAG: SDR family oxidoreductase [Pseudomonadota bacterium]